MKQTGMTSYGRRCLLAIMLFGSGGSVSAAPALRYDAGVADTSQWECNYCPYQTGLEGEISLGLGHVKDADYLFGNYTGLEQGSFGVLGADLFYRGDDANYWQLQASRLGGDWRGIRFEGGQQGSYRARVDYQEIPRLYTDSALTPFSGVGSEELRLPASWVEGGTTADLPQLDSSLHPIELRTDRKRLGVAVNLTPDSRWNYTVNFKRDRKEGLKSLGGSFLYRATLLPEPVNYTTDQLELGVGYHADHWQMQLGYLGSFFRNEHKRLRWDNPFIEPTGNANEGQLALAPDNTFHQLMLTGNYRFSSATQANLRIAGGQMLQDEPFLPYTINPLLVTTPLPRDSMDGEVRTMTVDARIASALTDTFTLQTDLRYNRRDNRTPIDRFDFVSTDAYLPGAHSNKLYEHTDRTVEVAGHYRPLPSTRLSAGAEYQQKSRSDVEVAETRERTVWAKVTAHPEPTTDVTLGFAHADRDASAYRPISDATAVQNPLLVKFNLAAREQQRAQARLHFAPLEQLSVGIEYTYRDNDYTDTTLGLLASDDTTLTLDTSLLLSHGLSIHGFATRERHDNEQAGSQNFSVPDWFATSEDHIRSYGFGTTWRHDEGEIEVGLDYVYSAATGKIDVGGAYPDLKSKINSAKAHVMYKLTDSLFSELSLFYEKFRSSDWSTDNLQPTTIPTVLTLGSVSSDYNNRAIVFAMHYRF